MQTGPVWIIDSDIDDQQLLKEVWSELRLPNELVFFQKAESAFDAIRNIPVAPFMIICDVNLPKIGGFEFREKLLNTHNKKCKSVPFIYWSTSASEEQITKAYD